MDNWFNRMDDDLSDDGKKKRHIFQDDEFFDEMSNSSFEEQRDFLNNDFERIKIDRTSKNEPIRRENTVVNRNADNGTSIDKPVFHQTSAESKSTSKNKPVNTTDSKTKGDDYYKKIIREMSGIKSAENNETVATAKIPDINHINRQASVNKPVYENYADENELTVDSKKNIKTKKKKAKSAKSKLIKSIIAIILVVVLALGGYAMALLSSIDYQPDTHKSNKYVSAGELHSSDGVYNILIIGTDARESYSGFRSDTMMLCSIDSKHRAIKLTSFLRDSYVYIPGKDMSAKLNASCYYGGPQMVIDTIEYNFKTKIDKYVMIDFKVFKTIIDDIGGITLTMTDAEAAAISKEGGFPCAGGTHHVKGRTALWYARIRHLDSDFKRTERQRKVIQAVVNKLKKCSPTVISAMLKDVLPQIQTDISAPTLLSLGVRGILSYLHYDICQLGIPADGTWSNASRNGQAVLLLDLDKNIDLLHSFIYDKSVKEIKGKK